MAGEIREPPGGVADEYDAARERGEIRRGATRYDKLAALAAVVAFWLWVPSLMEPLAALQLGEHLRHPLCACLRLLCRM